MHMADALLSPAVGSTMWAVSAATIAYCSKKVRSEMDDRIIPFMGVMGAFIFATQMISFTIPVTGSSGHLGGGLILSILLGPYAAFLAIASVLVVQALFFADGGLLALGCNIFNLGFFPAFIAYPLIYKKIIGSTPTRTKMTVASLVAAVFGLQLGAFSVVLETVSSGISSLPFATFAAIMQPTHLAIGVAEGLVTASVISFVYIVRPEILKSAGRISPTGSHPIRTIVISLLVVTVLTGGGLSWFVSARPDALEWSIIKVSGQKELKGSEQRVHRTLAALQEKISFLPDYSFKKAPETKPAETVVLPSAVPGHTSEEMKRKLGTSVSGIVGGTITLALCFLIGIALKRRWHNHTA